MEMTAFHTHLCGVYVCPHSNGDIQCNILSQLNTDSLVLCPHLVLSFVSLDYLLSLYFGHRFVPLALKYFTTEIHCIMLVLRDMK